MSDITRHPTLDDRLRSKKYPFDYSARVVDSFIMKYSRATTFVGKKLGLTGREFRLKLINQFMYHNWSWNAWRDTLKYVDIHNMYSYLGVYDRANFLKYLTAVRSLTIDDLIDSGNIHKFS